MNYSGIGSEWMMAAVFQIFRDDRALFLLNWISFLLMPGLLFSVFRMVGVAPRVAWHWMWLLPSGYCFVMQAGSIANDAYAVVFVLGAIFFALRARQTGAFAEFALSILAAALATGVKASNLPLMLPWVVAIFPVLPIIKGRLVKTGVVLVTALVVSFFPLAVLNIVYAGDWTGEQDDRSGLKAGSPVAGLIGNTLQLIPQTFLPPITPNSRTIENAFERSISPKIRDILDKGFPRFEFRVGELPQEESAGLGLGLSILLCISLFSGLFMQKSPMFKDAGSRLGIQLSIAAWIAVSVFFMKMGSESTARLLSPYYPLLILPALLQNSNSKLIRMESWRWLAILVAASSLIGLLLTPSRPILPVQQVLKAPAFSGKKITQRALDVYSTYGTRSDSLQLLRSHLPKDVFRIGMIHGIDDSQLSFWRPFGTRRVVELTGKDVTQPENLGLQWIVVKKEALEQLHTIKYEEWIETIGGLAIATQTVTSKVSAGPEEWVLVRMPD